MKLIQCYIENFGKLNKFTYHFDDGLNIIEEENGWGKTTFAAFIKAMFFGLEYRTGKIITDRKRYMPWNGSKFGGNIVFEKEGIQYKIERFFGAKEKEDTFTLYNLSNNMISNAWSEKIGEEIWNVDRDSYDKTAFITLNESSLLNDIISSKLGNIEDQEADLETSSKAVDLLESEIVKIKAKRGKSGLLGDKISKIEDLKTELKKCKSSLETIEQTEVWIKNEEQNLKEKNAEIDLIEDEQSKILLYEKKQQYSKLISDYEAKKKELVENEKFFNGKIISEEELNLLKMEASRYSNQIEEANKNKLSEAEKEELEELSYKFKEGAPKPFEIEGCNENIIALSNQKTELKNFTLTSEDKSRFTYLDRKYRNSNVDDNAIDAYLNDYVKVTDLRKKESDINNEITKLDEIERNSKKNEESKKANPFLFAGIGLLIVGVFLIFQSYIIVGGGITFAGLLIVLFSLLYKKKDRKEDSAQNNVEREALIDNLKEIQRKKEELKFGYLSFLESIGENKENIASSLANCKVEVNEYNRLLKQNVKNIENTEQIENRIFELKKEIESFLKKYRNTSLIDDYEKALLDLRRNLSRFLELSRTNKLYDNAMSLIKKSKDALEETFKHYYKEFPNDAVYTVNELTKRFYTLEAANDNFIDSKSNKEKFETENNVLELNQVMLPTIQSNQLAEELREKRMDLDQQKNEIIRKIERYNKDITRLALEADNIEDIESTITKLEIELEELEIQHKLLSITKDCLVEAKESLATKYMGEMSHTFRKYLLEIENTETDKYQIDINLDVKVEHDGELHDSSELSKGMKDLIQICMRMALVEAVYKDVENPILVLDDPFVNLDNNKIENASKLLKSISKDYQIIYFICHNSRNIL